MVKPIDTVEMLAHAFRGEIIRNMAVSPLPSLRSLLLEEATTIPWKHSSPAERSTQGEQLTALVHGEHQLARDE